MADLERKQRKTVTPGLAQVPIARVGMEKTKIKPLTLERAVEEYKNNPTPESLTQLNQVYWTKKGEGNGEIIIVPVFPLGIEEINERAKQGQLAVFNGENWVWIEERIDTPNLDSNELQLREEFGREGRQIMGLETYIAGGEINKLLSGEYFEERAIYSYSRVLNASGKVVSACFDSEGWLDVYSAMFPKYHDDTLGGRWEEVIKPVSV